MMALKDIEIDHVNQVKKVLFAQMNILFGGIPSELGGFLRDKAILTGGAISSLLLGETPKDYDLYLQDKNDIMFFKQYVNDMNKDFIQDADEKYVEVQVEGKLVTANATTFKNSLQVITLATADSRSTFDFVHCMPWYKISNHILYISKVQYNAILNKQLIKNPHKNAFALSHKRIEKYTAKGWRFPK
jgi:ABC-type antimicrobial peptide transport system permease subunit